MAPRKGTLETLGGEVIDLSVAVNRVETMTRELSAALGRPVLDPIQTWGEVWIKLRGELHERARRTNAARGKLAVALGLGPSDAERPLEWLVGKVEDALVESSHQIGASRLVVVEALGTEIEKRASFADDWLAIADAVRALRLRAEKMESHVDEATKIGASAILGEASLLRDLGSALGWSEERAPRGEEILAEVKQVVENELSTRTALEKVQRELVELRRVAGLKNAETAADLAAPAPAPAAAPPREAAAPSDLEVLRAALREERVKRLSAEGGARALRSTIVAALRGPKAGGP